MAIKKCSVWQLRVYIIYCIFTALHGVAGRIGLCALQSPTPFAKIIPAEAPCQAT